MEKGNHRTCGIVGAVFIALAGINAMATEFDLPLLTPLQQQLLQGFIGFDKVGAQEDPDFPDNNHGTIILDFHAGHKTCAWHWFPMQETRTGGDPLNNLYAPGGCLDKVDKITGSNARQYEYDHNRKAKDAGKQYAWWGHSDNAAEAACILSEPKKSVVMKAMDGSDIKFSTNDIQGLLVLVSSSLVSHVDLKGERSDSALGRSDDAISPDYFINILKKWSADRLPFVLDIDPGYQVWNYPYDQVRISESKVPPAEFDTAQGSDDGSLTYYHIEMAGTGYDDKRRVYECFVQHGKDGRVVSSGWIKTPKTHAPPDFMWRPHPIAGLNERENWTLRGYPTNRRIDPKVIYDIYMKSIE
jgi:hypothetical protein